MQLIFGMLLLLAGLAVTGAVAVVMIVLPG